MRYDLILKVKKLIIRIIMKITKQNPLLGAHMSIAGGVKNALTAGESIGCTAIQIFTTNNRQWSLKHLPEGDVASYLEYKKQSSIQSVIAHAIYLLNLGSNSPAVAQQSCLALESELVRCDQIKIPYTVLHPGAYLNTNEESCLERIAHNLNKVFDTSSTSCTVLLENMAGQGSYVGYTFEQLAKIIEKVDNKERIGICFDTCHAFAAGYDFSTQSTYNQMWNDFDAIIGLKYLKALHLNDSKKERGSRVDRHDHIGKGLIGLDSFRFIMNDDRFTHIPKILETPKEKDLAEDVLNLKTLRDLII